MDTVPTDFIFHLLKKKTFETGTDIDICEIKKSNSNMLATKHNKCNIKTIQILILTTTYILKCTFYQFVSALWLIN